jgi:hypothetical protein
MIRRIAMRWPRFKPSRWRRPRTGREWLITLAAAGVALALKLTIGLGVIILLLRHIPH